MKHGARLAIPLLLLASSLSGQAVCRPPWKLEETFRMGAVDGPAALTSFQDFDLDREGHMYVPQTFGVAVLDARGRPLDPIGRMGQGPGEFELGARWLGWRGDTLWVTDLGSTHFFNRDGTEAYQVEFRTPVGTQGTFTPRTPLADGSFLGDRSLSGNTIGPFMSATRLPLLRFSRAGAVLDTITWVSWSAPRTVQIGTGLVDHPLQDWSFRTLGESLLPVVATPDGSAVVLIGEIREENEAPSLLDVIGLPVKALGSFDLLKVGIRGDTLLNSTLPFEPVPVTRAWQDWLREAFSSSYAGDSETLRTAAREAITFPEFLPPVRQIVAGQDGSIWLLRELREDRADLWEIYDERGDLAGSVLITEGRSAPRPWAPRLQVLRATRDEVWGTSLDDLDVPIIHRYRVVKSC